MKSNWLLLGFACALVAAPAVASPEVDAVYPSAHALYLELHQHPELSGHEIQTAVKLAAQPRALGYDVTEHIGGTGIVAILRSGPGRTTASEDFSAFFEQGIPGFYLSLGGADSQKLALAQASGTHLPSNHSPLFAPDVDPALHTAITAEVGMLRDLLKAEGNVPLTRSTGGESHGRVQ